MGKSGSCNDSEPGFVPELLRLLGSDLAALSRHDKEQGLTKHTRRRGSKQRNTARGLVTCPVVVLGWNAERGQQGLCATANTPDSGSLQVPVPFALDGLFDAKQHGREPLVQPRDGVKFFNLWERKKRVEVVRKQRQKQQQHWGGLGKLLRRERRGRRRGRGGEGEGGEEEKSWGEKNRVT